MPSERIKRRVERLLDQAEEAADAQDWPSVRRIADEVLGLDPDNEDAPSLLSAAERRLAGAGSRDAIVELRETRQPVGPPGGHDDRSLPPSFAAGRYVVRRFLGEGAKKRVFLAHDALLDRDVAFCRPDRGRHRQRMGRLGR